MALSIDDEEWNFAYSVEKVNLSNITTGHPHVNHVLRAISAVTCSLSIMGTLAIISSYILIKDIRSKARELLVHLSIMDLTSSSANLIGIILPYDKYLLHQTSGSAHENFQRVCKAQAFFAAYGTIGSILWTLGVAVYLYYRIIVRNPQITKRVVIVLYVLCYSLPLYVSLWLLLTDNYGYPKNQDTSGGWCTILVGSDKAEEEEFNQELMLFMVDDIWILLTFVTIVPIYLIVHCQVRTEVLIQYMYTVLKITVDHFLTNFNSWPTKIHFGWPILLYIFNGMAINNLQNVLSSKMAD